jgi:DNA topoisomerase-1
MVQLAHIEGGGSLLPADAAAATAGLRYVSSDDKGIRRRHKGAGFSYIGTNGRVIRDKRVLWRIRHLAIPPAWTDVWICPDSNGHLQAAGFDKRGRKQYLYNAEFRALREAAKFEHILLFAAVLPKIRERVDADMRKRGLTRERVLATVVHLLETTLVRVGNKDYARQNGSYGLTTLREPHVDVEGAELRFQFKGKSGKTWKLKVRDRRVANVVRALQDLPGQQLFQYVDDDGTVQSVTSSDVNGYLREISGREITAKDFRTWAGTVMAAVALHQAGPGETRAAAKRTVKAVVADAAERLGNTVAICRKCYVHPTVIDAFMDGELKLHIRGTGKANSTKLSPGEAAVHRFLISRLS